MATKKKEIANQAPVDELLGDKHFIDVAADKENERYLVRFTDKVIGNNAYVRFDLKRNLGEAMAWDNEVKAFAVEAADYNKLKVGIEESRRRVAEITKYRDDMEGVLSFDMGGNVRFIPAFTKPGERHNGEILTCNAYFVAQASGIGKDGTKYVLIHGSDKFMQTQEDWRDVERSLASQFEIGKKVSILYGEKNKAQVQPYVPSQQRAKQQESGMTM